MKRVGVKLKAVHGRTKLERFETTFKRRKPKTMKISCTKKKLMLLINLRLIKMYQIDQIMKNLRIKAQIWRLAIECTLIDMNSEQQEICLIKQFQYQYREDKQAN